MILAPFDDYWRQNRDALRSEAELGTAEDALKLEAVTLGRFCQIQAIRGLAED